MNKAIKIIAPIVLVLGSVFVLNTIEEDVHVERSKEITADLSVIKAEIADFEKFSTWSPWADVDPNAKNEFKGTQGEVGAEFHWSGNDEVGTGYQKVTAITNDRIDIDFVFTAPWESTSKVYYLLKPQERSVHVTWAYDGKMPLLMSFFMDMDVMIGEKYEKGLNSLQEKLSK